MPLLSKTEWIKSLGTVYRQYPIEVVDLMLEQFRSVALHFNFCQLSLEILVANSDPIRA